MPQATANPKRRKDLQAALKRAKPDDTLTLEELAFAWGVTKQRFVTVKNAMARFPDRIPTPGNVHVFPARKALEVMFAYETRFEEAAAAKQAKTDAMLGRKRRARLPREATHTINELRGILAMQGEMEEQEYVQGRRMDFDEVAAIAGVLYGKISAFMGSLSNRMDPNGLFPPEQRDLIDTMGADALMELYQDIKGLLSSDAKPRGNRAAPNSARRTRTRR
jgi:hypothetical protein